MDALIIAVLNALWQGAALIALVALALRAGLRRNATTACVVWSITFLVVALLPALDLALARPAVAPASTAAISPVTARDDVRVQLAAVSTTSASATTAARRPATTAVVPTGAIGTIRGLLGERVRTGSIRLGGAVTAFARAWGLMLLGVWAFVAGTLLLRLARGYAAVVRMKRDATPLDDPLVLAQLHAAGHRRRATVARSRLVDVPCAVGFRRPMILIPARLAASLDVDDLARVVLHESAHLQRYDDWLNALEQVVCALQFFQPALYVARRGIDFEREVACDDRVLAAAGDPLRYAECLARIVQRNVRGPRVAVAPGFVLRRAHVVGRVRRIVDRSRDASPQLRFGAVALTAIVLAATLGIARLQVPVVAAASAAPAAAAMPAVPPAAAASRPLGARDHARTAHAIAPAAAQTAARRAHLAPAVHAIAATSVKNTVTQTTVPKVAAVSASTHARCTVRDGSTTALQGAQPAPVARQAPVAHAVLAARLAPDEASARAPVAIGDALAALPESVARIAPAAVRTSVQAYAAATAPRAAESATAPAAAHDGGDLLDALDEAKYPHPSVDDLIALRNQGISGDYVRRMTAVMRPRPALHDLMSLAIQGVTADYVAGLNRRLAAAPSPDQIVAVRVQGVSIAWLDGLAAIGYPRLSSDDAVSLAVQGISVAYVRGLQDAGLRNLTPSQLVALRVQGVDGAYVRGLAAHKYKGLSVDELIRLKVSGF
jgi:bla regulator protein blaR1